MQNNSRSKNNLFKLSDIEIKNIKKEKSYYKYSQAASVEALKIVQKHRGWVSDEAIEEIAQLLNISSSEVEEVATFYSQIFRQPVGRNIIKYCESIVCYICGYAKIKRCIESHLKIKIGETTPDNRFTLLPVCCLGNCDKAPTIMINDDVYENLKSSEIPRILEKYQ